MDRTVSSKFWEYTSSSKSIRAHQHPSRSNLHDSRWGFAFFSFRIARLCLLIVPFLEQTTACLRHNCALIWSSLKQTTVSLRDTTWSKQLFSTNNLCRNCTDHNNYLHTNQNHACHIKIMHVISYRHIWITKQMKHQQRQPCNNLRTTICISDALWQLMHLESSSVDFQSEDEINNAMLKNTHFEKHNRWWRLVPFNHHHSQNRMPHAAPSLDMPAKNNLTDTEDISSTPTTQHVESLNQKKKRKQPNLWDTICTHHLAPRTTFIFWNARLWSWSPTKSNGQTFL